MTRATWWRWAGVLVTAIAVASSAQAQSHIRPGDKVYLHIWDDQLKVPPDTIMVDADGRVMLPRQRAPLKISQYPASSVPDSIRAWLHASYKADVAIDVQLLGRVTVIGDVRKPDVFYVDPTTEVRDVIARAGGIADNGDLRKVSLVRGGVTTLLPTWNTGAAPITVQSGDLVTVGRKNWFVTNAAQLASFGVAFASLMISLRR